MRLGLEADVELAAGGVGRAGPGHGDRAAHVLLLVELVLDRVAGAARAVTLRVAALRHEARNDAMKYQPVVEPFLGQRDEVLHRLGRVVWKELDLDDAAFFHGDLGNLFHASGSFLRLSGCGGLRPCAGRRDERDDKSGQKQSDFHVLTPSWKRGRGSLCPAVLLRARSTQCAIRKIRAKVDTCRSARTSGTSPSSPTSTTARRHSWTPCCGSRVSSAPTSTWPSGSWTRSTWSARRASRSWRKTRPSTTRTPRSISWTRPATPTSAARSSGRSRWWTACCSSWTRPKVRCPRRASCSRRRSRRD